MKKRIMNNLYNSQTLAAWLFAAALLLASASSSLADVQYVDVNGTNATPPYTNWARAAHSISWSQIGAKAGADYQGDGLAVIRSAEGARLRCVFQRLEGEATREGLWLTSTAINAVSERFRIVAAAVGRQSANVGDEVTSLTSVAPIQPEPPPLKMPGRDAFHRVPPGRLPARARWPLTARACASPGRGWWRNTA